MKSINVNELAEMLAKKEGARIVMIETITLAYPEREIYIGAGGVLTIKYSCYKGDL